MPGETHQEDLIPQGRVKGGQTLNAAEKQNKAPGISEDPEQQEDLEAQAHQEDKTKI